MVWYERTLVSDSLLFLKHCEYPQTLISQVFISKSRTFPFRSFSDASTYHSHKFLKTHLFSSFICLHDEKRVWEAFDSLKKTPATSESYARNTKDSCVLCRDSVVLCNMDFRFISSHNLCCATPSSKDLLGMISSSITDLSSFNIYLKKFLLCV